MSWSGIRWPCVRQFKGEHFSLETFQCKSSGISNKQVWQIWPGKKWKNWTPAQSVQCTLYRLVMLRGLADSATLKTPGKVNIIEQLNLDQSLSALKLNNLGGSYLCFLGTAREPGIPGKARLLWLEMVHPQWKYLQFRRIFQFRLETFEPRSRTLPSLWNTLHWMPVC